MFHGGLFDSIPGRDDVTEAIPDRDDVRETVADRTGVTDFFETERGRQRAQEAAEADGVLERFDTAVATGTNFVLDHPDRSVQEGVRGIIGRATGLEGEELAERARDVDEGITERIDERVEDTPFDHRGTDAIRWAGDTLIGEGVRTFVGAGTGIDTREGDLEARTGALETLDVALTVGTAGVGRAAIGAARAARSGDGVTDTFRAGDTGVTRVTEDAATPVTRTTDDVTDATRATDDALPVLHRSEIEDTLPAAVRATDDVTDVTRATDGVSGFIRGTSRAADDVTTVTARTVDDAGTTLGRVTQRLGQAGARIGTGTRRALTSRPARLGGVGAALGAGVVGGGALINELQSRYEMADGTVLTQVDSFQATDRFEGGLLYRVAEEDGPTVGYSVVVGRDGRNLIMLAPDGRPTRAPLSVDELAERERGGGI